MIAQQPSLLSSEGSGGPYWSADIGLPIGSLVLDIRGTALRSPSLWNPRALSVEAVGVTSLQVAGSRILSVDTLHKIGRIDELTWPSVATSTFVGGTQVFFVPHSGPRFREPESIMT